MKISAVYSYPGIALCLAVAVLVRRECPGAVPAFWLAWRDSAGWSDFSP